MFKRINEKLKESFQSEKDESDFLGQYVYGVVEFHKIITILIQLFYFFVLAITIAHSDYKNIIVMCIMSLINFCQYFYFHKRPSLKCLIIINLYNILIACLRLYQALIIVNSGQTFTENQTFFLGTQYFTVHICLLINPYLSTNIWVIAIIFMVNLAAAWVIDAHMFYQGLSMILQVLLLVFKIKIDIKRSRNMFILKQEINKWGKFNSYLENILKILIEQPYVIINFVKQELKFSFVESNQAARDLTINDSISMRQIFRSMTIIDEKNKVKQNLEIYIFKLIKDLNKNNLINSIFKQELFISNEKVKYQIKIFPVDQEANCLLITFHKQDQQNYQSRLQKTIINQQIGFCNLIQDQSQFCLNLKSYMKGDKQKLKMMITKKMLDLTNYMSLFKTDQKITLVRFDLRNLIFKINKLFPNQFFYLDNQPVRFISDYKVISQIFYNLFSLLSIQQTQQIFMIRINKYEHERDKLIQISILSKPINFEKLQKMQFFENFDYFTLTNLAQIQSVSLLQYLMLKKLIKIVSPNDKVYYFYISRLSEIKYSFLLKLRPNLIMNTKQEQDYMNHQIMKCMFKIVPTTDKIFLNSIFIYFRMREILKSVDQSFSSQQLEKEFLQFYHKGILEFHQIVTVITFLFYVMVISITVHNGSFTPTLIVSLLMVINYFQWLYFRRNPSVKCIAVINIYNLLIALLRLYQAFIIRDGYKFSQNETFFMGTAYFTVHISLLVNPCLSTNIVIMFFIFLINITSAWIIQGGFYYLGLSMILQVFLLLWKLKIDLSRGRSMFVLKQQKMKLGKKPQIMLDNILKILIEQPYVITNFVDEELKFIYVESNQAAKDIHIYDSTSMRQIFRQMKLIVESKITTQDLEDYIYQLILNIKQEEKNDLVFKQELFMFQNRFEYGIKIFPIDQYFKSFLITFHNVGSEQFQSKLKKNILNQQIGFCNLVKEQSLFCNKLKTIIKENNKKVHIMIEKQVLDLINYMNLFKTDLRMTLVEFDLKNLIYKVNKLFPNQFIYVNDFSDRFVSDQQVVTQILYNLFNLLNCQDRKQIFVIQIEKLEDQKNNYIELQILSKTVNLGRFVNHKTALNYTNISLSNISQIKKKGQYWYLMLIKLLKLVSPYDEFDFQYNYTDYVQIKLLLYQNMRKII